MESRGLAAVILAGGLSSRMERFKPLLDLGGKPAILRTAEAFQAAGVGQIIAVLGHAADQVEPFLAPLGIECVRNPSYEKGMFSSIQAGLSAIALSAKAFFLIPADIPLVRPSTLHRLIEAYRPGSAWIVYPVFGRRRGHPPLISTLLIPPILAAEPTGGLRPLLDRYEAEAVDQECPDEAIHWDMDTWDDYQALRVRVRNRGIPTSAECESLLRLSDAPDEVVRHGRAVAQLAMGLGRSLNASGTYSLNLDVLEAAGRLHDMVRSSPGHAEKGAALLRGEGFPAVADCVESHMDLGLPEAGVPLTEREILFLADKLIEGETKVSLDRRFQRSIERAGGDPLVLEKIQRVQWVAKALLERVEREGCPNVPVRLTQSVCPDCLRRLPAQMTQEGDRVFLEKTCPNHGAFKSLVWEGPPSLKDWCGTLEAGEARPEDSRSPGCPFECGLCSDHRQQTCCVLVEVTGRCNLACPVCFASAGPNFQADPSLDDLDGRFRRLAEQGWSFNIQLSGGEPTLRNDLPQILQMGRSYGFSFFQLNTNGLRLSEPGYASSLKAAGLDCVFLQFDGTDDAVYRALRGQNLLERKEAAIREAARAGLGVVLVPTIVPGINDTQIGAILRYARERAPGVRGVHFQPVSYFGRYPGPVPEERITLGRLLRLIEEQTAGQMRAADFTPPQSEHPRCSFHADFVIESDGTWEPLRNPAPGCCRPAPSKNAQKAARVVARQWSAPVPAAELPSGRLPLLDSFDLFLRRTPGRTFSVSGMLFQDAWNLDLERLRSCHLHVLAPTGDLIPFCAYNLTGRDGRTLYRGAVR